MTIFSTTFVLNAPVYSPSGTTTAVYPYGTTQVTFTSPLPAVLILNNNDRYAEEQDKFDISYDASLITITNKTGALWPVGTLGLLQVADATGSGNGGSGGEGSLGLYDPLLSDAVGDATTDDSAALDAADGVAVASGKYLWINKVYKIDFDLALTSGATFGPQGRLKPASGVTVTLAGGFTASITQHVFDISLGGNVWSTKECPVSARNYGAVGNGRSANSLDGFNNPGTNDRAAFQALIDCCLYYMKAQAVHFDAGDFYIADAPLIVNYAHPAGAARNINIFGAGLRYGPGGSFAGTWMRIGHWGNGIEVQGMRGARIEGVSLEGPAYWHMFGLQYGSAAPSVSGAPDPYNHLNWMPAAGNAMGSLCRFKMNSGIHADPRCGLRPVPVEKTAVRLVVKGVPATTGYAHNDVVQGVTLQTDDRILFAAPIDIDGWPGDPANGVYKVKASGIPDRTTDFATGTDFISYPVLPALQVQSSSFVTVTAGDSANVGTKWVCNNHAVTVGTTNIDFCQFDGTLTYPDYAYPVWHRADPVVPIPQYEKALGSALTVSHCIIRGFGAAFAVKGCDAASNADYMQMEYCSTGYPGNVYSMAWGHNQGRMQGMSNCRVSPARCHISTSVIGQQNGKAHFSAVNSEFAGCVDILDIPTMGLGGGVSLIDSYCEGGNRIGRVVTTSTSGGGFEIAGGNFGFPHEIWSRVPRWIIDCRNVGVIISPTTSIVFLSSPLIIRGDPHLCQIWAKVLTPIWMSGAAAPATIHVGEAIMLHSTMGVLFNHDGARRQGPWTGGGYNDVWSATTGGTRTARAFNRHAISSVTSPIPFCAVTAGPADMVGTEVDGVADPLPVALGSKGVALNLGGGGFTGAPSQTGRIITLVLSSTPSVSNAQNLGYMPGSIICDLTTGNLFVILTLVGATITAKQLNNYDFATNTALWPSISGNTLDFYPTGHYTPGAGLELTWTASPSTSVTVVRTDGANLDGTQLPPLAAKMVNNALDAMTPTVRASSAISSIAGTGTPTLTLTMAGAARAAPAGNKTERAGIWFMPRLVITSAVTASGTIGVAFSYTITGLGTPTGFTATPLPPGLSVNAGTGAITGTPTGPAGITRTALSATGGTYGTSYGLVTITIV